MEYILPKYHKPLKSISDPVGKVGAWEKSIDAFDEKRYKESLVHLFNYINILLLINIDTKKDFKLSCMQGSARITIEVANGKLKIESPVVRITDETNVVALLRRVAEINFNVLDIEQIVLEDDVLTFRFEAPLSACQPNKIYNVIYNIATKADDYDDIFIEEYKAKRFKELKEPYIRNLSSEEKKETVKYIRDILNEVDEFAKKFVEGRKANYRWDIITITLLRLSNLPYMQGRIRTDLIDNIERMYDGEIDLNQRINKGLLYIKELQSYSDEYYENNLYHAEQLISLRWVFSHEIIRERMEAHEKTLKGMIENDDHLAQSYFLYAIFLKLIYNYNLYRDYKEEIEYVLKEVSQKNTKDAAPKLVEFYWDIRNAKVEDRAEKRKRKKIMKWLWGILIALIIGVDIVRKFIL